MIPYREVTSAPVFPIAVYGIVAINVAIFLHQIAIPSAAGQERFIDDNALVPYHLTHMVQPAGDPVPTVLTLITSQFLHGSVLHIFFNMLFLLVFGPEIELLMGHVRFTGFYLVCGILGGLAQVSVMTSSHVPGIGASGAIAGVLGAFLVRFPLRGVETIVPIGCIPLFLRLPAYLVIGLWAATQFVHGFGPTLSTRVLSEQGGGTAYFAHIGGFIAGVLLASAFAKPVAGRGRRFRYYGR